jgi:hypothetical protein
LMAGRKLNKESDHLKNERKRKRSRTKRLPENSPWLSFCRHMGRDERIGSVSLLSRRSPPSELSFRGIVTAFAVEHS